MICYSAYFQTFKHHFVCVQNGKAMFYHPPPAAEPNNCTISLTFIALLWASLHNRVRWFQLFVVDSFGQLSKSTGYWDKHLDLNGYGVGGLLYPPQTLPMWQNSFQVCKNRFFGFPLLKSDRILAIFTQTSSVTKRNIMDRMDMALGMVYTPHQWTYSDRKDSYREKSTFSFLAANLSRTGQCFQHGKGVSLVLWSNARPNNNLNKLPRWFFCHVSS